MAAHWKVESLRSLSNTMVDKNSTYATVARDGVAAPSAWKGAQRNRNHHKPKASPLQSKPARVKPNQRYHPMTHVFETVSNPQAPKHDMES